jgi:ATP-binding cassette, subfamily B, bacterial
MRAAHDLKLIGRLLRYARPRWGVLGLTAAASLLSTPLTLLTPLPVRMVVDSVIGSAPLPPLLRAWLPEPLLATPTRILALAAGFTMAITLLLYLQGLAYWLLLTFTGEKLAVDFRAAIFRHAQRLSFRYHDGVGSNSSIYRIQYDAPAIQYVLIGTMIPMAGSLLTLFTMLYVMAVIDRQLALVALTVTPVLYLLTRRFSSRLRQGWHDVKRLESSAMGVVHETLSSLRVVKAFGREALAEDRFLEQSNRRVDEQMSLARLGGTLDLGVGLTMAAGTAAVLFIGAGHVRSGALSLGQLLVVMAYLAQIYEPLKTISKKIAEMQASLASADRAFGFLDEIPSVVERADARRLARAAGDVEFRGVSFGYDTPRIVLRDVSFRVGAGTHVGIVGETGAGKTTLIGLLMRFYDPAAGTILLDGVDVREYRLADLQNQFGLVLQEPVLFSTTIAENIAYGRANATRDEIADAAKAANAHNFITSLPDGYDTQVGERGMSLSGGERQRISIARAFLKDAPILVLDEPTASVDVKTEGLIVDALSRLAAGRTTFLITHRLSALRDCDAVVTLDCGRVVGASARSLVS